MPHITPIPFEMIDELRRVHEQHIQKLKELHSAELEELTQALQKSRQSSEKLTVEKAELEDEIEGMRTEVEMLRQSFDLVQERLRRVLVSQDDLVKLVKLIDQQQNGQHDRNERENKSQTSLNGHDSQYKQNATITSTLNDIETKLKGQQDSSAMAALQAIKYFKKLDASDPVHLCRLLEIPFCPERSFSLSTSLLSSISVHMTSDPMATKSFKDYPVYSVLLDEIIKLKRDSNDLCKIFLKTSKGKSKIIAEITKMIAERKEGENCSVLKWLVDGGRNEIVIQEEMSVQKLFSTFLSTFK